ncbi:MAG: GTP-binding protein [Hyphomonadaceae bacterium]
MKMRMFIAETVEEAEAIVRKEMGPDAVILSIREEDGRVEIRAAVERTFAPQDNAPRFTQVRPAPHASQMAFDTTRDDLASALRWQGAPDGFVHIVSEAGGRLGAGMEHHGSLTAGLEGVLSFAPLQTSPEKSYLLIGPPGGGKSTAAAKLSLHHRDRDSRLALVAADFDILCGAERLAALARQPSVKSALTPDHLGRMIAESDEANQRLVIDGPAFNPLSESEMKILNTLISRLNVEPVLVLSAEGNALDLEDTCRAFATAGVRRVILSKLDVVRRRGGAFAAISSARLSIAQLGMASSTRSGLAPASAALVSRLLLAGAPEAELLKGAA